MKPSKTQTHFYFWKDLGITGQTVRNARKRAKDTGRMVEIWAGACPVFAAYANGSLRLTWPQEQNLTTCKGNSAS